MLDRSDSGCGLRPGDLTLGDGVRGDASARKRPAHGANRVLPDTLTLLTHDVDDCREAALWWWGTSGAPLGQGLGPRKRQRQECLNRLQPRAFSPDPSPRQAPGSGLTPPFATVDTPGGYPALRAGLCILRATSAACGAATRLRTPESGPRVRRPPVTPGLPRDAAESRSCGGHALTAQTDDPKTHRHPITQSRGAMCL